MSPALILCAGLLAADPPATPPSDADLKLYESARAKAGRDPEAHVKLALWCEAHGMSAERIKHLGIALIADPKNAAARGLMGMVQYKGKWLTEMSTGEAVRTDADLADALNQYHSLRAKTPNSADGHWKLGLWCAERGLDQEARAHFTWVTRLDPKHEAAWKRLGCEKHGGRWMTPEQFAAEREEADAQRRANQHWQPTLTKWKGMLELKARRAEAEALLADVNDPRAVPSVIKVFGAGKAPNQLKAVQLLGQIESPAASRALATLSIFGKSDEVRREAAETLTRRDPREFVDLLIGLIRKPVKYEVTRVGGPGSPGQLLVEGKKFNVNRLYAPPPAPSVQLMPGDLLGYDEFGLPVITRTIGFGRTPVSQLIGNPTDFADLLGSSPLGAKGRQIGQQLDAPGQKTRQSLDRSLDGNVAEVEPIQAQIPIGRMNLEAQKAALLAETQLEGDVAAIERYNDALHRSNDRVLLVLKNATGQDLGEDPEAWAKWWVDEQGYAVASSTETRPTFIEEVPLAYQPQPIPVNVALGAPIGFARLHSCFGAGTMVRTLAGPRTIESLRIGDLVLTQDTATGALSYQPILNVFHNPPNMTLRIDLGDETIVATAIHRFWRAGKGWAMARELKPGDTIRTLAGPATVASVKLDRVQPVFNLEVGPNRSFLVGEAGALVHDNSLVEPALRPFDAPPDLALAAPGSGR